MAKSFRDPGGHVLIIEGRVIRIINQSAVEDFQAFLASHISQEFINRRLTPPSRILSKEEVAALKATGVEELFSEADDATFVEHERIAFQSFPYEWPPEMLHSAAKLTLDMAETCLAEGFGLKDATPYNILYSGPRPVFVDLLSFEKRDPRDPTWLAYAQFVRTFLLPLLVNKHFRLAPNRILAINRDGLEPEEILPLCSYFKRFMPPFLSLVTVPAWLARRHNPADEGIYRKKRSPDAAQALFILRRLLRSARRLLEKVSPPEEQSSPWSDYMNGVHAAEYLSAKQDFVEKVFDELRPARVLDVGCNTGHFSAVAARHGASVVAVDADAVVVGQAWRRAQSEGLDILSLVVDIARPSPAMGWRNSECPSFLERARGRFDMVMMLALVHHLLVAERIPLNEIINLAAEMTTRHLLIEFVPPGDTMFRRLARGRDELFTYLTQEFFEHACQSHFEILQAEQLRPTDRWLYLLRKKELVRDA